MTRSCVAGVDGGGTRTRALLLAPDGARIGRAEGPAALVHPRRPASAARVVADTVRRAAEAAGVALPLPALWAGLAGAGRATARRDVEAALGAERVARAVRVGTDVEAAFHDAFGGGAGVMVVAGTGSAVLGVAEDGRRVHVGGWGGVMGDDGSGHHIGVAALRAVARAADGRTPPTDLTQAVLGHLGLDRPRELPAWAEAATKADIAALAPLVIRAARSGDAAASTVVRRALDALGDQLSATIRALLPSSSPPAVALTGGLIAAGGPLHSEARELVASSGGQVFPRAVAPERGAARLALALLDGPSAILAD